MVAMIPNNFTVVRCLVEAGCSVSSFDFESFNLLHMAAMHASLDSLEYLTSLELSCVHPFQKARGNTPWDYFVYSQTVSEWKRGNIRNPNFAEQEAFVKLYQGVRDRWLRHDICILEQIISALRKEDITEVRKNLASLIEREIHWGNGELASWYQAVDKRIQHMEWELAAEDVEECLVDMRKELDTPVWKIPSTWGEFLWDDGDERSASVLESLESARSSEEPSVEFKVPAAYGQDE
ncbi:hypothetical protein FGRMN_6079 [Fusarium graminum]|nr:hypothetical protein FGRMN_6079 [Fusarium graminum]